MLALPPRPEVMVELEQVKLFSRLAPAEVLLHTEHVESAQAQSLNREPSKMAVSGQLAANSGHTTPFLCPLRIVCVMIQFGMRSSRPA